MHHDMRAIWSGNNFRPSYGQMSHNRSFVFPMPLDSVGEGTWGHWHLLPALLNLWYSLAGAWVFAPREPHVLCLRRFVTVLPDR